MCSWGQWWRRGKGGETALGRGEREENKKKIASERRRKGVHSKLKLPTFKDDFHKNVFE